MRACIRVGVGGVGVVLFALTFRAGAQTEAFAFEDVTGAVGINHVNVPGPLFPGNHSTFLQMQRIMGQGAAVGDYDNDGDLDIYLCAHNSHPNKLYRNNLDQGLKTFTEVGADMGVDHTGLSRLAHFVDLDNDGWLDLVVVNDDHPNNEYPPTQVYRNNGADEGGQVSFANVTDGCGLRAIGWLRCGSSFADFDNDGLLDVYITNWSAETGTGSPFFGGHNMLFKNLGGFKFADVTEQTGLAGLARDSFTPTFIDFDADHRPDILVAVDHTSDEYYHNTPAGFVRLTEQVGATHKGNDMGAACADFDDDGDLDVFQTNIADYDHIYSTNDLNVLYANHADAGSLPQFVDEAPQRGLEYGYWGWGVEFTDPDQDADLDLFIVDGFDDFIGDFSTMDNAPPVCYRNDDGFFTREDSPGMLWTGDSRCLIAFDYDRDGDDDMLVTNHNQPTLLLENISPNQGRWLRVQVRQSNGANTRGVGVTVYATFDVAGVPVTKRRDIVSARSYLAGVPAEAHLGLGDATGVDELTIEWTDGTRTTLHDVGADQFLLVTQPTRACPSDLDASGALDALDVSAFLALFADLAPAADLAPPSGIFDYADVLAFLRGFAVACE